jgi:hypothetical protein
VIERELSDNVSLLRLVWSPRCFENGRPNAACFSKDDLNGTKYISADCEIEIMNHQTRGDLREKERRTDAKFIRLYCGDLRGLPDKNSECPNPLVVERFPTGPRPELGLVANPAHCAIRNKARNGNAINRAYIDYLRTQLLKLIRATLEYKEVFPH